MKGEHKNSNIKKHLGNLHGIGPKIKSARRETSYDHLSQNFDIKGPAIHHGL